MQCNNEVIAILQFLYVGHSISCGIAINTTVIIIKYKENKALAKKTLNTKIIIIITGNN